jgi:hypothetical protein
MKKQLKQKKNSSNKFILYRFYAAILLVLVLQSSFAQEKFNVCECELNTSGAWTVSKNGSPLALEYEMIVPSTIDTFIAVKSGKVGMITIKNEIVMPFEYDAIFRENSGSRAVYFNKSNKWIESIRKKEIPISFNLFNSDFSRNNGIWIKNEFHIISISNYNCNVKSPSRNTDQLGWGVLDGVYVKDSTIAYKPIHLYDKKKRRIGNSNYSQVIPFGSFLVAQTEKAFEGNYMNTDSIIYDKKMVYDVFDEKGEMIFNKRLKDEEFINELLSKLTTSLQKTNPSILELTPTSYSPQAKSKEEFYAEYFFDFSPLIVSMKEKNGFSHNIFIPLFDRLLLKTGQPIMKQLHTVNNNAVFLLGNEKFLTFYHYDNLQDTVFTYRDPKKVSFKRVVDHVGESTNTINNKFFGILSGLKDSLVTGEIIEETSLECTNVFGQSKHFKTSYVLNNFCNARPQDISDRYNYKDTSYRNYLDGDIEAVRYVPGYEGVAIVKRILLHDTIVSQSVVLAPSGEPLLNNKKQTLTGHHIYDLGNCLVVQQVSKNGKSIQSEFKLVDAKWLKGETMRYVNVIAELNNRLASVKGLKYNTNELYSVLAGVWEGNEAGSSVKFTYAFEHEKSKFTKVDKLDFNQSLTLGNADTTISIELKGLKLLNTNENTPLAVKEAIEGAQVYYATSDKNEHFYFLFSKNELSVFANDKLYKSLKRK